MTNAYSPQNGTDADAPWLFRQRFRLPWAHDPNAPISMEGDVYHLDWKIHGGKGTNVNRDTALALCMEWGPGVGLLQFALEATILVLGK